MLELDAGEAPAVVEHEPLHRGAGQHDEVRAIEVGLQEADVGVAALVPAVVHPLVAEAAEQVAVVEV